MATFVDDDVGKALSDLTNHRLRIEARLKQSNEVSSTTLYSYTVTQKCFMTAFTSIFLALAHTINA